MLSKKFLQTEIELLIRLKQEGGYWDFKREWYSNDNKGKRDMLHDIICMANNLENHDAYIIIGIDEETDWNVTDVSVNEHRRNTQDLVNFLRGKHFAGGYYPIAYVETLSYNEKNIDVIIIENNNNTPFYLTEEESGVHPNNIYVRYMDGNTPINKSASLYHIELLWKKRFRILEKPIEKMKFFLQNVQNWRSVPSDKRNDIFYEFSPEYTIRKKKDYDKYERREFFMFHQKNSNTIWGTIKLRYFGTTLDEFTYLALDGGRYFTVMPEKIIWHGKPEENGMVCCYHFIRGTVRFSLYEFYNQQQKIYENPLTEQRFAHKLYSECFIIFFSTEERDKFMDFVHEHWDERDKYHYAGRLYCQDIEQYATQKEHIEYQRRFYNMQILKNMLNEFREN